MSAAEQVADASLVRRARSGDEDAFRELFDRYATMLRARVGARLSPALLRKVSAADILQEAYLVASRRLDEFEDRGPGCFGPWIGGIVENKVKQLVDRFANTAKRDPAREVSRGGRCDTAQFVGRGPSPSDVAMAGELQEAATRALQAMPSDYREVLRLLQDEELDFKQAAARMGRTLAATRRLYSRALARYAATLKALRGGEP